MKVVKEIQQELAQLANPQIALQSQRFFKTGPGEYGEGDQFRGIRVPLIGRVDGRYYPSHLPVKSGRATFAASSFRLN